VMAHAQNQISSFGRNERVHLNRPRGVSSVACGHSRRVRISGSNAGYTVFRGSVKGTGYPLLSSSFHFTSFSHASPCAITFQLDSNKNQQSAEFLHSCFNYIVFDMFRTSKCSSSGRLVHVVLWYFFHASI
jgi:hypothetical protein